MPGQVKFEVPIERVEGLLGVLPQTSADGVTWADDENLLGPWIIRRPMVYRYGVDAPLPPGSPGFLRYRETDGHTVSPMSDPVPIVVPEPSLTASLMVGAVLVSAMQKRRGRWKKVRKAAKTV